MRNKPLSEIMEYRAKHHKTVCINYNQKKCLHRCKCNTIVARNTIGEYALIGAGSVVTKDVPPYHLFYGNPATHKGYVTEAGEIISMDLKDNNGNSYCFVDNKLNKLND